MRDNAAKERLKKSTVTEIEEIYSSFSPNGSNLTKKDLEDLRGKYGTNKFIGKKEDTVLSRIRRSFVNPFSSVLMILAVISFFTDIVFSKENKNYITFSVIITMLLLSGIIRFISEMRSKKVTDSLIKLVDSTILVKRNGEFVNMSFENLVVGDTVKLHAGDRVPADIRLIHTQDLFVSESILTGESEIKEKNAQILKTPPKRINDYTNVVFGGTTVMGGQCEGVVISVGSDTLFGGFSTVTCDRKKGFDRGSNSIAMVLIRFMSLLVPIVFVSCGLTKGDWVAAFLFALSVAVGLTPELLPMVITACLAKGSYNMGKKQTVVKNINAMQSFGSMDVLCVDKTGTLTNDSLTLEYFMDILGNENQSVLDAAYLNSYNHSGIRNHLDQAILRVNTVPSLRNHFLTISEKYQKKDELPFDYTRKFASVLLSDGENNFVITKGDVESVIKKCGYINYIGKQYPIDGDKEQSVSAVVDEMTEDGMKVLAIAYKKTDKEEITQKDEEDLTLIGYLAFFDAPKESAKEAIQKLTKLNVSVKVLTGDSKGVAYSVCKRLSMNTENILTGSELESLTDDEMRIKAESTQIFAELTPEQKEKLVSVMQNNGHTVGFLGDGINDLQAVLKSDVGVSVDTASPAIKETCEVVLLKKDLGVLEKGILEGRRAFSNMTKYIKITASSNFGNIIAIVFASVFLPFFPMTSLQILFLNLLYDVLCLVIPWDKVDREMCEKPLEWSGRTLSRFMLFFGPCSSIFDIAVFAFLMFFLCPQMCGGSFFTLTEIGQEEFISIFQTGWFLESMWTQILILHLLRTAKLPFIESRPSKIVFAVTLTGIATFTLFAMTPLGAIIGLKRLPFSYFLFLIIIVVLYLSLVTLVKKYYIKHYKTLI